MTERPGHASELAAEARDNHADIVVAVGGDGTVNEVARSLVHSDSALGILPCGSGNGLARHLLLPMNLKKSIEIINACKYTTLTTESSTNTHSSALAEWASMPLSA